jgi:hypothetical protein
MVCRKTDAVQYNEKKPAQAIKDVLDAIQEPRRCSLCCAQSTLAIIGRLPNHQSNEQLVCWVWWQGVGRDVEWPKPAAAGARQSIHFISTRCLTLLALCSLLLGFRGVVLYVG